MQDSDSTTTRKRRFRYTYVACEKCKARKSKCSGGQPCGRCRDANLTCFYSRTTRFRAPRRSSAATGRQPTSSATDHQLGLASDVPEADSNTTQPQPTGPTASSPVSASSRHDSFEHCLRLAESRFAANGMEPGTEASPDFSPGRRTAKFGSEQMRQAVAHRTTSGSGSVLDVFDVDSWVQILQTYEEEIGLQYPCIDIRHVVGKICQAKAPATQPRTATTNIGDRNLEDMALVLLAIISAFVDPEASDVAMPHVEEICGTIMMRTHLDNVQLEDLRLLILTCMFFFLSDREKQAWRITGVAMRLLQEITSESDQTTQGVLIPDGVFWTVYTLDRRWSFGTGLPFAVQDVDIVRPPPASNNGDLSSAYLSQMVLFCGIAAEVRALFLNNPATCRSTLDAARDLVHFRIVQWQQNIPERLQFRGIQDRFDHTKEKRGDYKLRLMLYLRANLMRTIILRKSATRFGLSQLDDTSAQNMAQIAHDTIRVLSLLVQDTDIYHAQHKTFNHFLETALSALLLVMCSGNDSNGHGPGAGISLGPAKTTSYLRSIVEATELVQKLATCSPITRRLRDKLQGIQKFIDAMMVPNSRSEGIQPDPNRTTRSAIYWDLPSSTSGTATVSSDEHLTGQKDSDAAALMNLSRDKPVSGSAVADLGTQAAPDQYAAVNNMYSPAVINGASYSRNDERPHPTMMNYSPYMAIPGSTAAISTSIPSFMFSTEAMESALADVGVDAFADLNGIMMDYDNLLF